MICFVTGAAFGFILTALSYFLFSSSEDSVSRLENKHTLIMERIKTLEDRIDDLIDQFEGDSDSDSDGGDERNTSRFSDDASSHSHRSHRDRMSERESNASSHASDHRSFSHPPDDEVHSDPEHKDHGGEEHSHRLHETEGVEGQSDPSVHGETREMGERREEGDDLLSL